MKHAILVPGRPDKDYFYDPSAPSNSNDHWLPWLSKQLIVRDIHTVAIEPPQPYSPRYDLWRSEFERFEVNDQTMLIGHSCGGGFLLRWLSENRVNVGRVVLVAPWINPDNNPSSDTADFFDFDLDQSIANRCESLHLMHSTDDVESIVKSVEIIRSSVDNIVYHEYVDKGHFIKSHLDSNELPELLEILTGESQ